jgi:diguanylate cyclase (GGDEF)-like protein
LARAERTNTPVAFLVVDVNGMRHINQDHGYATGDAVLRTIGTIIRKQLRLSDVPARWGVDEFAVLLYGSDAQGAVAVARRIAVDLAQESFQDPTTGQSFQVTVSQGIAAYPAHTRDKSGAELVDRAYEAMRNTRPGQPVAVWSG